MFPRVQWIDTGEVQASGTLEVCGSRTPTATNPPANAVIARMDSVPLEGRKNSVRRHVRPSLEDQIAWPTFSPSVRSPAAMKPESPLATVAGEDWLPKASCAAARDHALPSGEKATAAWTALTPQSVPTATTPAMPAARA